MISRSWTRDEGEEQEIKENDEKAKQEKILKIYSRWISNLKPCSIPDSGIKVCSARHDKNFPWSSSVGWYVKIDLVKFPSCDVCAWRRWIRRRSREDEVKLSYHSLMMLSHAHPFTSRPQLCRSFPPWNQRCRSWSRHLALQIVRMVRR